MSKIEFSIIPDYFPEEVECSAERVPHKHAVSQQLIVVDQDGFKIFAPGSKIRHFGRSYVEFEPEVRLQAYEAMLAIATIEKNECAVEGAEILLWELDNQYVFL